MRLSKYFTLAEMTRSQTASRRGIPNKPGPSETENLKALCVHILDPVRENYGVAITPSSGYRSPKLNAAIGGSKTSQHMAQGDSAAVDFVVPGVPIPVVCLWIQQHLEFDQLIQEFYNPRTGGGWVHVSYRRNGGNRRQFIKIG